MHQNQIVTILRKQVVKQAVGGRERNFEIVAIYNRYKDILDDLIDCPDPKSPPGPINERSRNAPRSRGGSTGLLEEDYLDEDVSASNRSSQLAPKTKNS